MAVLRFRSFRHSIYYFECRHGVCPTPSHPETSQLLLTSVEGFSQPPQILDASMFGCTTFGSLLRFGNGIRVSRVRSHGFQHNEDPGFRGMRGAGPGLIAEEPENGRKGLTGRLFRPSSILGGCNNPMNREQEGERLRTVCAGKGMGVNTK
jgi:hypothetical protein